MSRTTRRVLLYSVGVAVLSGLGYAGFLYEPAPDAMTRLSGARTLAASGNFDAALEVCDLVAREHPDNFEERLFRATILAQAERYEEALPVYDEALRLAPVEDLRRDLVLDRASVLLALDRREDVEAARDDLARAVADHRVHLLDATVAEREGRWEAALAAYAQAGERLTAAEQDPAWVDARRVRCHMILGRAASDAGNASEALRHFDAAVDLAPESVIARLAGARVRLEAGETDEAVARVEQAHGINPRAVERALAGDTAWAPIRDDARIRALSRNETAAATPVCPPPEEG